MESNYLQQRRNKQCFGISKPDEKPALKKISIRSVKRIVDEKLYLKKRKEYLIAHPKCEVKGCNHVSAELHHKRGRVGKLLFDERYFLGVCPKHHREIEINPWWAKENKLSESRLKK